MADGAKARSKFRDVCKEKGWTAEAVSKATGVSVSTVYSYWQGQRLPSRKTMKLFEEKLGIDSKEIFY